MHTRVYCGITVNCWLFQQTMWPANLRSRLKVSTEFMRSGLTFLSLSSMRLVLPASAPAPSSSSEISFCRRFSLLFAKFVVLKVQLPLSMSGSERNHTACREWFHVAFHLPVSKIQERMARIDKAVPIRNLTLGIDYLGWQLWLKARIGWLKPCRWFATSLSSHMAYRFLLLAVPTYLKCRTGLLPALLKERMIIISAPPSSTIPSTISCIQMTVLYSPRSSSLLLCCLSFGSQTFPAAAYFGHWFSTELRILRLPFA